MPKIKVRNLPLVLPIPTVLAGAVVDGKPNYSAIGNCGIINFAPPVIYISSIKSHYTNRGIRENGVFSVNLPSVDLVREVDYCGLVSGSKTDKSGLFATFYGATEKAPLIVECPVNLACRVSKTVEVYNMDVFFGEVVEVYVNEDCLTDGQPDPAKIRPLVYGLDNIYRDVGAVVGKGYSAGKALFPGGNREDTAPAG